MEVTLPSCRGPEVGLIHTEATPKTGDQNIWGRWAESGSPTPNLPWVLITHLPTLLLPRPCGHSGRHVGPVQPLAL
jgi:hypothetical protein